MTQELRIAGRAGTEPMEVDGNRLTLLPDGPRRLERLLHLIETARQRIDLYFYIFAGDAAGLDVREALIDACNRGVAVTVLADAFGSAMTPGAFFAPLIEAGARYGCFGKRASTRYLIRNHQKMIIADGKRAIVGGFNIDGAYFVPESDRSGWKDFGLEVDGAIVSDLSRWFTSLAEWTLSERQSFRALRRMVREWQPAAGCCAWLMGGPTRHLNGWARRVKADLQAGQSLDMAAAYFSPGWNMVRRLGRISRKGRGPARLIVPNRSDNMATIGAARHIYRRMLKADVAIHEYLPQKLHAKLIVIDDISYVGSANFDMRSLFLNVELVLRIEDRAFAQAVRAQIDDMAAQSKPIDNAAYRTMAGPFSRLRWWLDYLLVGVLDYTVTRRLNFRRGPRED